MGKEQKLSLTLIFSEVLTHFFFARRRRKEKVIKKKRRRAVPAPNDRCFIANAFALSPDGKLKFNL